MADGDTTTTTTTGTEWTSAVPEAIRGHDALKGIDGVGTLASKFVELSTPKPFADQLPEDIRGEATFKDIKDLGALAKSYHSAQKMLGVPKDQLLRLPADDKPESWAPVYDKLGRPAKADGYTIKVPDGAPAPEAEAKTAMFAKAHELGFSQKQLDGMYGFLYEQAAVVGAKTKADHDAAIAQSVTTLKTEWGQAYDQKMTQAMDTVSYYDDTLKMGGNLKKALDTTGLGNNPGMAKLFAALAANLKEDGKLTGKAFGGDAVLAPVEARQSISALKSDTQFMKNYMNPNKRDQAHIDAVAKMEALYKIAYPEQGQAA